MTDAEKALAAEIYKRLDAALINSINDGMDAYKEQAGTGVDYDPAYHYQKELESLKESIYQLKEDLALMKF